MSKLFTSPVGMVAYMVGGCVRDMIMDRTPKDFDYVVVGSTPEQMLALGFKQVGADFPVFLHPETNEEFALARTERKTGHGYGGFTVHASPEVTLEEDLSRRDLTMNAIALSADGTLTDPYGGVKDIGDRLLRHVSDAAFGEDPVRVLRLARFAARYSDFAVAPETMEKAREMVRSGELNHLVAERVWAEVAKGLMEDKPSRMFEVLRDCGALAVLIPELDSLWGVPQHATHHPEIDVGIHTMMALDLAARRGADLAVRFAVLLHDLGKGLTPAGLLPSHHGHEEAGVPLATAVATRLKVPSECKDLAVLVCAEHLNVHRCQEMRISSVVKFLMRTDAFRRPDRFAKILQACEMDARGRLGLEAKSYPQPAYLLQALASAKSVDVGAVVKACKKREFLQDQILEHRVSAVRAGFRNHAT